MMAEIEMAEELQVEEDMSIASINNEVLDKLWDIEGLIITKSEMRTFDRAGEPCGEMFCFTMRDQTGDIEVAVFDHKGAHQYYNIIVPKKIFLISNLKVVHKKVKYNLTDHAFELEFTHSTEVEFLGDGPGEYKPFEYPFDPIDSIDISDGIGSPCNILGICVSHNPLTTKVVPFGRKAYLREIFVIDQSGGKIKIDLWEHEAKKFDTTGNPVVYLYGARLREYQGELSLRTVMNTMMLVSDYYLYFILYMTK